MGYNAGLKRCYRWEEDIGARTAGVKGIKPVGVLRSSS
jgi:hypothetical protein